MQYNWQKKIVTFLCLILIVFIAFAVYYSFTSNSVNADENILTHKVGRSDVEIIVNSSGFIQNSNKSTVYSRINSKITELNFTEGSAVKTGDIIVKLDDSELQQVLRNAEYNYNLAVSKKNDLVNARNTQNANLKLYKSKLEDLNSKLESAQVDYDTFKILQYTLEISQLQSSPNQIIITQESINQADDLVNLSNSQVEIAKKNLSNAVLTSPIEGILTNLNIKLGGFATVGGPVFTVSSSNNLEGIVQVSELDIIDVVKYSKTSNVVEMNVDALGKKIESKIRKIDDEATTLNGIQSYKVYLTPSDTSNIRAGMSVSVEFPIEKVTNVISVPTSTIKIRNGKSSVQVKISRTPTETNPKNYSIEDVEVTTGISNNKFTEVKSGLKVGDEVVTLIQQKSNGLFQ